MNLTMKRLLQLDVVFKFNLGYLVFFNLSVWGRVESVRMMSYYFLFYMVVRLGSLFVAKHFIERDQAATLIRLGFAMAILQFVVCMWVLPFLSNDWVWMSVASAPFAVFSSFFQMAFNQILAYQGRTDKYMLFFSYRTYLSTLLGISIPLLFGWMMEWGGLQSVTGVFLVFSLLSFVLACRLPHLPTGVTPSTQKTSLSLPVRMSMVHLLFLVTCGFVVQYHDMFRSFFSYAITDDAFRVGWLNVGFALVSTLCLILVRFLKGTPSVWFGTAFLVFTIACLLPFIETTPFLLVISTLLFTASFFFFLSIYHSATFHLTGGLLPNEQFHVLFKREIVATVSKGMFALGTMLVAMDTLEDPIFKAFTYSIVVCAGVAFICLLTLDSYIKKNP